MNHYQKKHCFYIDLQLHPPKLSRDLKNIAKNRRHLRMNSMVSHLSQSCENAIKVKPTRFRCEWRQKVWVVFWLNKVAWNLLEGCGCSQQKDWWNLLLKSDKIFHPSNLKQRKRRASSSSTPPSGLFRYLDVKVFNRPWRSSDRFPLLRRTVKDLLLSSAQHPMASSVCQRTWRSVWRQRLDVRKSWQRKTHKKMYIHMVRLDFGLKPRSKFQESESLRN